MGRLQHMLQENGVLHLHPNRNIQNFLEKESAQWHFMCKNTFQRVGLFGKIESLSRYVEMERWRKIPMEKGFNIWHDLDYSNFKKI